MTNEQATPRPLIIDTDGGVDDAAALWWAATDPTIELVGVTTTAGCVGAAQAAVNVLTVLDAAGHRPVPVAVGLPGTFGPTPDLHSAAFIHGDDGLGNAGLPTPRTRPTDEPAIDLLRRLVDERPGQISVVALAPLTNLGRVLDAEPTWAQTVRDVTVMGGSITRGGNAQPWAEANIAGDPAAAARVISAGWRRPPLLVGLDATHEATLTDDEFALLAQRRTPAAAFLDEPLRFYRTFGSTFTAPLCPCHDLFALLAWAHPQVLGAAPELPLAVDTAGGPAWGATIADLRAPIFARVAGSAQAQPPGFSPWRVALGADVREFRAHVGRLFGAPPQTVRG